MHLSSCKNATLLQDCKNAKCALALTLRGKVKKSWKTLQMVKMWQLVSGIR